jgi:uncharacterized protein (TIGR01244 family)
MSQRHLLASSCLLVVLGLAGCQSFDSDAAAPATTEIVRDELGDLRNCTTWGQITTGGQPSPENLELAAKRGFTRVINLRTDPEVAALPFDEAALCTDLGMDYYHFPVMWSQMDDADYDAILSELEHSVEGRTLLHCASANRTAMFVAIERVLHDGVSYEDALEDARMAGLKPSSVEPLQTQLERLGK